MGTMCLPRCLSLSNTPSRRTKAMVVENSLPRPEALSRVSNVDSGGTSSGTALRRRAGMSPPSASRRSRMYLYSGESFAGLMYSSLSSCSSVSGSLKRSRNACSEVVPIFFCWCVMFCASPASPMP